MSLYDILTMGSIKKRDGVKKSISWYNIDFKKPNVKIKEKEMKQLVGANVYHKRTEMNTDFRWRGYDTDRRN